MGDAMVSFCDALNEKFSLQKDLDGLDNIFIMENTALHLPNSEKRVIGLDHCNINSPGCIGDIKKTCPLVEELDLSSNHLTDWKDVLSIVMQLDHLKFLNLSHNALEKSSINYCPDSYKDTILEKLVLNNSKTDIETLLKISKHFPSVNELHMSMNNITHIPEDNHGSWNSVRTLHFAKNGVADWRYIEQLGKIFPELTNLNVCENLIDSIPHNHQIKESFPNLKKLNLMWTKISEWDSVDCLRAFPALSEVRIKSSPVYRKLLTEKENRQMIIARLPEIKYLNASKVENDEKEDAERMFIRYYMKQEQKPERYRELVAKYGELDELANVNMKKENLCNVLINGDIESSFLMQVDLRTTVKEFRKVLAARFDLRLKYMRLIHFEQEENILTVFGGIAMEEMYKTLSQYYVTEGNTIQVVRLDLDEDA